MEDKNIKGIIRMIVRMIRAKEVTIRAKEGMKR
jgi:hypothetical protein